MSERSGSEQDFVVLDHGTGAKLSRELVERIAEALGDVYIGQMEDSALLDVGAGRIAVTTDSFVVTPLFFGSGDIGKVSVCGTVNDLAVSGARPLYLTLGLILEAGFPMKSLLRILASIRAAALEANVKIVAGDTKVVRQGEADQIFINTTGVGVLERSPLRAQAVRPGNKIIISGNIGNHSIHLLSVREGLGFERRVESDCAPLNGMIDMLLKSLPEGTISCMRDVTRGGLCAVLHEFARASGHTLQFHKERVPVTPEAVMAADMLGIELIHLANEGCLCLFVDEAHAEQVLGLLREHPYGRNAAIIGEVTATPEPRVYMVAPDGTRTMLEELYGAELPRLC
ncbi:hydrogenase expression/formation protein HypE [Cystobacter ferrugineus]|uniref:Hydrogenase expression/formation protein HypE n=1 Tax=Cystobacter ferrugineus TaxID=83449 RepID=A0A1L9AWD5_9BACT|nr:hydrogenase expression/formation protein HypE [Cystobacter ferrugineus]OJH34306.1 hydrogenase expression/formation protein HypE [Cystobacter ferrugineus]